jgi:hypothetical protein
MLCAALNKLPECSRILTMLGIKSQKSKVKSQKSKVKKCMAVNEVKEIKSS